MTGADCCSTAAVSAGPRQCWRTWPCPGPEKLLVSAGIPWQPAGPVIAPDASFFLENRDPEALLPLADRVVIYRWNRHYPSDVRWEGNPADYGFTLAEVMEFPGKSHETITTEVYVK